MAKIIFAAGTSHTPLLALQAERWGERAAEDMKNPALTLSDGRVMSYAEIEAERGTPYEKEATTESFVEINQACQQALDRLADEIEAANPDVVLIIGDDQDELFGKENIPALAMYYGDEVVMHPRQNVETDPDWRIPVTRGYAMDEAHVFPGSPVFAEDLIRRLIDMGVDMGVAKSVPDPAAYGFGHAYGFVVQRLFRGKEIPIVPILLNTYFPPNTLIPSRCYDVGTRLRRAIEESEEDLRVAIIASGGLSHFVTDAPLDRMVLKALAEDDREALSSIPVEALLSGSSEIRNWIMLGGAVSGMNNDWSEYYPIYRTPVGTGVGVAFATWQPR